jgi:site-specific DNA-methyltransferase (adenine-specific)
MLDLDRCNIADGLTLLRATPHSHTPLVIFDPEYRQVLDHLKFGNEGARQKGRAQLPQMSDADMRAFGREIVRILRPSGYVARWLDKFELCEGGSARIYDPPLSIVDLITWNKGRIGMGYRTRRMAEYLMLLQKPPKLAKATWARRPCIPDVWDKKITDKIHVHQKPFGLQKALIQATSKEDDVVVDPTAGSFSVMYAAHACGRHFLGADLLPVGDDKAKAKAA